jgi:hypothetical protein
MCPYTLHFQNGLPLETSIFCLSRIGYKPISGENVNFRACIAENTFFKPAGSNDLKS